MPESDAWSVLGIDASTSLLVDVTLQYLWPISAALAVLFTTIRTDRIHNVQSSGAVGVEIEVAVLGSRPFRLVPAVSVDAKQY